MRSRHWLGGLGIGIGLLASTLALAGDVEDKKGMKTAEETLTKALASVSAPQSCGKNSMKFSIDWPSFADTYVHCSPDCAANGKLEIGPQNVGGSSAVFDGMASVCRDDNKDLKEALVAKVKNVVIKYDPTATPDKLEKGVGGGPNSGPRLTLKNGTLTVGYNWKLANISSETAFWFRKHL